MVLTDITLRVALAADAVFLADCFLGSMREAITASRGQWDEVRERSLVREPT